MTGFKVAAGIAAGMVSDYCVSKGALYLAMRQPPERFGAIIAKVPGAAMMVLPFEPLWMRARLGNLRIGDPAQDFLLPRLDGAGAVRLSAELPERPVVLVFGSYTWHPFRREAPALNRLFEQYQDRVAFYVVYIQEAHPTDLWQMASNVRDGVLFRSPGTESERTETASACNGRAGSLIPDRTRRPDPFQNAARSLRFLVPRPRRSSPDGSR